MVPNDLHTPWWHVLIVRKGHERKISRDLQTLGFEVLLPYRKVYRRWSDRRKQIDDPLFKGYAFVLVSEARRKEVFQANKAMTFLRHEGKPCVLREPEVELLKIWSLGISTPETDNYTQLQPGTPVEILEGAFAGQKGIIRSIDNENHLRLELLFAASLQQVTIQGKLVKVL